MIIIIQKKIDQASADLLFDQEGLQYLRALFNKEWSEPLKNDNGLYSLDHEHLSSKAWGGEELSPEFTSEDAKEINSLKVVYLGKNAEEILN